MNILALGFVFITIILAAFAAPGASNGSYLFNTAKKQILSNKTQSAVRKLNNLLESNQQVVPADYIHLTLGRAYFQRGQLGLAIEHYRSVPKSSDFWLEAVEEVAWSYLRQNREDMALAELKTLLSPVFDRQIGSEPYYLAALTNYKVCNYPAVFKVTAQFKKRYFNKIKSLQSLRDEGTSAAAQELLAQAEKGKLTYSKLAHGTLSLPQLYFRDKYLMNHLKDVKAQRVGAKARANRRLQQLARRDLKEVQKTLNRLHLIEAEVIQRIHYKPEIGKKPAELNIAKKGEVLVFPVNDNEVWLDELDNYHVGVRDCPNSVKGTM